LFYNPFFINKEATMKQSSKVFKFGAFSLALVILLALIAGCGSSKAPPSTPSPTPSQPAPTGNQPPVIPSLTPSQTQVFPSSTVEIQCIASDPNGDKLNYTWAATGGSFSGAGASVTWLAPKQYGTYTISVTVDDGKGASAQSSVTLSVGANQSPQISSLSANPTVIGMGGNSLITCVANDADGDAVRYDWKASEGSISGVGSKVTWFPPNKGGTFNVICIVNDGKGGETQGNVAITVTSATKTVTINVVQEETGTVSRTDKDRTKTKAGDDEKGNGYRSFWSFNIFSLNNTDVKDARLIFTTRLVAGNPFAFTGGESLGGLLIWQVRYADQLPDYDLTGGKLEKTTPTIDVQPTILDVTPEVAQLVKGAATRFQIEARFLKDNNGNGVAEYIEWSNVKLEVTYTEK
jgi:hypothetical protein